MNINTASSSSNLAKHKNTISSISATSIITMNSHVKDNNGSADKSNKISGGKSVSNSGQKSSRKIKSGK